ncbi:MAG: sugar kinase [Myxococcales bacterium]|nr:MAG: sugar kinase [Myxococcales bacterium]
MRLVIVGSVAYDTIATAQATRERILGGSASYAGLAASRFAPAGIVAVVGDDFAREHLELLRAHGVDVSGVERLAGKTFFWSGVYSEDFCERKTIETQLNVFRNFAPKLSCHFKETEYLFLANIQPELQLQVLDQVARPRFVACDTMNLWIDTRLDALKEVFRRVDLATVNDEEARLLTGLRNIHRAAEAILAMGPKYLIIKRGEHGSALYGEGRMFALPAYPVERVVDPTGAGDSFAGGLLGALAKTNRTDFDGLKAGVVAGTLVASFTVEDFSVARLCAIGDADLRERAGRFAACTHWDDVRDLFA